MKLFDKMKKSTLLRTIKQSIKPVLHTLDMVAMRIAVVSQSTSSLYWMVRGGFGREHQSVLAGKIAYYASLTDPRINTSLLRRNVHRLEKGLLMRPRRVPFALDYIGETVQTYVLAERTGTEASELAWARDVLQEYMEITPPHPVVEPLRAFVHDGATAGAAANADTDVRKRIPYVRDCSDAASITYEEFLKLARYRRSVRWYLPRKVPREMIERAIEAAAYSPTACNRQPYEFHVFDDSDLVSQIIKLPGGTPGFSHQVPAVAIVVGKQRNYFGQHDRHCIYTDASLAIMSFVYALEVQGLGSCCINWPDLEPRERRMESLLGLAADERPIMLVSFGWPDPDGMVACSTKKPVSTLCRYNLDSQ